MSEVSDKGGLAERLELPERLEEAEMAVSWQSVVDSENPGIFKPIIVVVLLFLIRFEDCRIASASAFASAASTSPGLDFDSDFFLRTLVLKTGSTKRFRS